MLEKLSKETIMYLIFGVFTTAVDYVSALILFHFTEKEILSNTIAWVIAVLFAYITNKLFVFESKSFDKSVLTKEIHSFVGSRVATLIGSTLIIGLCNIIHLHFAISKLASSFFAIVGNYILSKLFVFKNKG